MNTPAAFDRIRTALGGFLSPGDDPVAHFVALFDALRPPRAGAADTALANYTAMVGIVEAEPAIAQAVRAQLARVLISRRLVDFFASSGVLPDSGFFSELSRRVTERLLPTLPDERDLRGVLRRVMHRPDDWVWLQAVPPELSRRFWLTIGAAGERPDARHVGHVLDQALEGLLVVAYRVGGLGIEHELIRLGEEFEATAPAFRAVAGEAQRFVDARRAAMADPAAPLLDERQLLVLVDQCERVVERARRAALKRGTSLRLTYLLRRTAQSLARLGQLARLASPTLPVAEILPAWADLMREALRAENRSHSITEHVSRGIAMLALRVTDNAARTGEHYIANTRPEYRAMWSAAAGAGLIIGAMALLKIFASKLGLPPAGDALAYSLIYGGGFVLVYMLHLTIATKQPAMTAQTLADSIGSVVNGRLEDMERVVDLVAAVARSQLAAILGNVGLALPTACAIAAGFAALKGAPLIDVEKAAHLLHDLDPLGWALPHAALAGVFLFLSGVISGYFDNKASYSRIGARVAALRWLRGLAGEPRAQRVGDYVEGHLGGLMGNFLFGCMLGSAGSIGEIFGLPIDIRHIAFASANLGYAWSAFGFSLPAATLAWAALGVALIGAVNLAVSFALALWMALRARGIGQVPWRELLGRIARRLRERPGSFFVPPRVATGTAHGAH